MGMIRFLADENFDNRIIRGARARLPNIYITRVQDVGLRSAPDNEVLAFAADNNLVVLSHDESTMGLSAAKRIKAGLNMPGLFLIPDPTPLGPAISAVAFVAECSRDDEWRDKIEYLPL